MSGEAFSKTTLRWLIGVGVFSFVGALLLSVFGPELKRTVSVGADTYSNSAIGHRALVDLLRKLDIPVVTSRHGSGEKASGDALLVLAEPLDCQPGDPRAHALAEMIAEARNVLLVLPKWRAVMSKTNSQWSDKIWLRPEEEADGPLRVLTKGGFDLRRVIVPMARPYPRVDSWNDLVPTFPLPIAQFVTGSSMRALVETADGILLGEMKHEGTRVLVLTDPDVLANAGLGLGDNAPLVVAAIERIRPTGAVVVVDETIHGHGQAPSIWRELFTFPLLLLVLQGVLTAGVLVWAGMGRFGAPQRAKPALEPGRKFLVSNTAELLRFRGIVGSALTRYFEEAVASVARQLHAPSELRGPELDEWLKRVGERRGTTDNVVDLRNATGPRAGEAGAGEVLGTAQRVHRWKTEILHGP